MPPRKSKSNGKVIVAGINSINQISEESNKTNKFGVQIVSPPNESHFITPECLSYSVYTDHSIICNQDKAYSRGPNTGNLLSNKNLKNLSEFNELTITDKENTNYLIISAVCGSNYTAYLLKNEKSDKLTLACFYESDGLAFIDINEHIPINLFGGRKTAAAIDNQGNVIIISHEVYSTPEHSTVIISLPNNEKSIYVACLEDSLFILSNKNKVYEYSLTNSEHEIKEVEELENERITNISGTWHHVLAVTEDQRVFGRGSNEYGQLCFNLDQTLFPEFVNLSLLNEKNITSAYAGCFHSLFVDSNGKVLSCGRNANGELLLSHTDDQNIFEPTETKIEEGARFCIAGCQISCVFVSCNPPRNSPNQMLQDFNPQNLSTKPNSNILDKSELSSLKDPMALKSKLLQIKEELEAKNKFFDLVMDQNQSIIERLENLDQKIVHFIKINKLTNLKKTNKQNASQKRNLKIKDNSDEDEDDSEDEKPKAPPKRRNKPDNKSSLIKKGTNDIYLIDSNSDSEDIFEEIPKKQNNKKRNNPNIKSKQQKQKADLYNKDISDNNENIFVPPKKQKPSQIKKPKPAANNYIKSDYDNESDLDDEPQKKKKMKKASNSTIKSLPTKKKAEQINNDNSSSDEIGEDFDSEPPKRHNNKKTNTQEKKMKMILNNEISDEDDNIDGQPMKRNNKKQNNSNIKTKQQKQKVNYFNGSSEEDEDEPPKKTKLKKNTKNTKKELQNLRNNVISDEGDDDDSFQFVLNKQNMKRPSNPTYKTFLQKNEQFNYESSSSDNEDIYDLDDEQPKRQNMKKPSNSTLKPFPRENLDSDNENEPKRKRNKKVKIQNIQTKTTKNNYVSDDDDDDEEEDDDIEVQNQFKQQKSNKKKIPKKKKKEK